MINSVESTPVGTTPVAMLEHFMKRHADRIVLVIAFLSVAGLAIIH